MLSDCKFDCTCRVLEGCLSRAHKKFFFEKKMPLCHLPCVYRGSRGGIMVALVAFSDDFLSFLCAIIG